MTELIGGGLMLGIVNMVHKHAFLCETWSTSFPEQQTSFIHVCSGPDWWLIGLGLVESSE